MAEKRKTPMPGETASQGQPYNAPLKDNRAREAGKSAGAGDRARERTDQGCAYTVDQQSRRKLD